VILWDLESGQEIRRIVTGGNFTTIVCNPGSRTAYVNRTIVNESDGSGPTLLDLETGQIIRTYSVTNCCTGFAIHPDGRTVFTGGFAEGADRFVREWDLENDREVRVFGEHDGFRTRLEVSPDGNRLLSSGWDGTLILWDLETGQEIRRFNSGSLMLDIDMSPDGSMAITPGGGGTAILWDLSLPVEMDEVRDWIVDNRYVRELSCEERELYLIKPLCEG
jgi:WD40 repeat protein